MTPRAPARTREDIEWRLEVIEDEIGEHHDDIRRLEDEAAKLQDELDAMDAGAEDGEPAEPEPFSLIEYPHFVGCNCGGCPAWGPLLTRPVSALQPARSA